MCKRLLVLLAALLLVTPLMTRAGDKKGDLELVQGTWMLVSAEADGKAMPPSELADWKQIEWVVMGEKIDMKIPPKLLAKLVPAGEKLPTLTFKIDPKARPKAVDITITHVDKTATLKGVYALEGDKLTLCGSDPKGERPTDFTTKQGSRRIMGVFKRKAK
jgi:uncharacterized protein (TIGR03067 family)